VVKTMHQVVGGPLQPAVAGPNVPRPGPLGTNLLHKPALEDPGDPGHDEPRAARCFVEHNDTPTTPAVWTRTSEAHSGATAVRVSISAIDDWGFWSLVPTLDLGGCAPAALPGHTYEVSGWYTSTAPVTLIGYYRDGASRWQQLDHSGAFPASSSWRQATFRLPAMPAGATGVSGGFWVNQVGTFTMDDLSVVDTTVPTKALKLRLRGNGAGEVVSTPAAVDCRATCATALPAGASVTLRVTPDAGTRFRGWGGACSGSASTCTVRMTKNVSVTVRLARA
jgi:hypothetical protein